MAATTASKISQLYVSLFGRAPDSAGLAFWSEALDSGAWTFSSIAKSMFDTTPARAYYPTNATADAVVTTFYTNVLGRAPDAEGLAFWVKEYNAAVTAKDVGGFFAKLITNVVEYKGTDAAGLKSQSLFANKVTVAEFYGTNGGTIAGATAALTGVTEVASTVDTAKTAILNPVVAGQTFTLTTGTDTFIGTAGNDTFNGTSTTYANADQIIDSSTTDNDTYNLSLTAASTPNARNIENVNLTIASTGTVQTTASSLTGVKNLTVTKTNVTVGGSTLLGDKGVDITALDASKVAKVTVGTGSTGNLSVVQATKAGVVIDAAATTTGTIAVTGAVDLTANNAASTVAITKLNDATEDAKAVSVNAANASSVTTADTGFTGAITFNAAKASTITILNATGGATVNGGSTSTADTTIRVDNIDDSGASITTGTGNDDSVVSTLKSIAINLDGTSATTDAATITAAGFISLDADTSDLVETVNLSGNGAAVTYKMVSSAPTTYNLTGSQSITVQNTAAAFATMTLTDATTAGTTTAKVTSVATSDLSKISADVIELSDAGTSAVITVKSGANINLASDQTTAFAIAGKAANAEVTLSTADDTAANGTTIDLTVAAFTADTYVKTLNLNASVGKFTATSTTLDYQGSDATTLNISGTKNVTLGTTAGKTINASGLTGALSLTALDGIDTDGAGTDTTNDITAVSITSGSGNDAITLNDAGSDYTVFTVDAGNGNNTVTITAAKEGSQIVTGSGTDAINVNAAAAYVVVAGAGSDTVTVASTIDTDSILTGGDGTDSLVFAQTGATVDLSNNANFTFREFETVDISALASASDTITISAAQFANQTFTLKGNNAADNLIVTAYPSTTAVTIDASNVTIDTAKLTLVGSSRVDTITGTSGNDAITATAGSDVIDGGAGTDTYTAATASQGNVINLSASAITATSVLAKTGLYTADSVTSVASGKTAQLFTAAGSSNLADQQTLTNVENVVGTSGKDYIVGSAGDNVITGGAEADYINLGLGTDTVVLGASDSYHGASGVTGAATSWDSNETIVFTSGVDVIAGFTDGTDKLQLATSGSSYGTIAYSTTGTNWGVTTEKLTSVAGNWDQATGTFTYASGTSAADMLVLFDGASGTTLTVTGVVLLGAGSATITEADLV